MNSSRLHRAVRKLVRPLKRKLQGQPSPSSIDDLTGGALVLLAHPDDEVFCSGLICELLSRKEEVHLVLFTRGEGGERGELPDNTKLGEAREAEMKKAASSLGVTSLTFLDYLDPKSESGQLLEPDHDSAELLTEIEALAKKHSLNHLITHGSSGEYWHPAHLCLHRHARTLNRRLSQVQLWTFNAWTPTHPLQGVLNQDDPASFTLEAGNHHEKRLQSLSEHHSQRAVFERFANGSLADFVSLTATESYRKW